MLSFIAIFGFKISFVVIVLTAAAVGVILNLAIWFAWHALRLESGGIDYAVAFIAIVAWLAMERFKIGVIPVLTVCAMLGMVWKNL